MIRAEHAMMNEAAEGTRILDITGDGLEAILKVLNDGKKGEPFVAEHLVVFERLQRDNVKMALFHDGCAIWMNTEVSPNLWKLLLDDARADWRKSWYYECNFENEFPYTPNVRGARRESLHPPADRPIPTAGGNR